MTAGSRLFLGQETLGFHHAFHYCSSRSVIYRLYRLIDGRYEIESDVEPLEEYEPRGDRESEAIFSCQDEGGARRYLTTYITGIKSSVESQLARPDPEDLQYEREIEWAERMGCGAYD